MRSAIVCLVLLVGCGGKVAEAPSELVDSGATTSFGPDLGLPEDVSPTDTALPSPACPAIMPREGEKCAQAGRICDYTTPCGSVVRARCTTAGWTTSEYKPCTVVCPPTPRKGPCNGTLTCTYDGPCGKITSECKGPGSNWSTSIGMCPPGMCPTTEPAVGDACLASGKCSYMTTCGGEIVYCDSSGYTLAIDYALCMGCPKSQPTDGDTCTGSSTTPCWYANECGKRNESRCYGGTWKSVLADCTK